MVAQTANGQKKANPNAGGYSRNANLGAAGAGTTGALLQGGPQKQQMNFTSYESGFGARGAAGGAPSLQNGNSQRGLQNDGFTQIKG